MKRLPGLLVLLLYAGLANAQTFNLDDLLEFTSYTVTRFDAHLAKKDFRRDYESPKETPTDYNYFQIKKSRKEQVVRKISMIEKAPASQLYYQTSSFKEYNDLRKQLQRDGYVCYEKETDDSKPQLYQRGACSINTSIEIKDSTTFYTFFIEKAPVPKPKDVVYAEDLLQFNSHEFLASYFGSANVKKDLFHYTENETNQCSILFPNTSREVIFIWEDEVNYRNPSFLIVGGQTKPNGANGYAKLVTQYEWQSKQGIHSGMLLHELQKLNGADLNFYGWSSDKPGVLTSNNKGAIDFSRLGIVLSCLNCVNNKAYQASVINSNKAIADERKIYVSTMIILPEKTKAVTVSR